MDELQNLQRFMDGLQRFVAPTWWGILPNSASLVWIFCKT